MKKNLFCFSLFISLIADITAKDTISGYIITLKSDTIHCKFEVAGRNITKNVFYYENQNQIKQIATDGKLVKFSPFQIQGYSLFYPTDTLNYLVYTYNYEESPGKYSREKYFIWVAKAGHVSLLKYYYIKGRGFGPGMLATMIIMTATASAEFNYEVVKKGESNIYYYDSFKRYYKKYFADYPALSKKIADKVYKQKDLPIIVDEYNKWYSNKK